MRPVVKDAVLRGAMLRESHDFFRSARAPRDGLEKSCIGVGAPRSGFWPFLLSCSMA
jgi:hypothetical protein